MLTSHQKARKSWWAGDSDTFCFRLQNFFNKIFQNGVGVLSSWPWLTAELTRKNKIEENHRGEIAPPPPPPWRHHCSLPHLAPWCPVHYFSSTRNPSHTLPLHGLYSITSNTQFSSSPPPTEIVPYIVWAAAFIFRFIQQICFMKKWFEAWLTFMNNLGVFRIHKQLNIILNVTTFPNKSFIMVSCFQHTKKKKKSKWGILYAWVCLYSSVIMMCAWGGASMWVVFIKEN